MRYLLDEMDPPAAAAKLRERAVDAIAVKDDAEIVGADDATVLAWAYAQGRVVVTENVVDFARLGVVHDHCGIVLAPQTRYSRTANSIGRLADALAALAENPPPGLGRDPLIWWL